MQPTENAMDLARIGRSGGARAPLPHRRVVGRRNRGLPAAMLAACGLAAWLALAATARAESRGELLYTTHCNSCHTTQMHWRDRRSATDWPTLQTQVRRWQGNAGLQWTDEDIAQVVQYLNQRYYRFAPPGGPLGRAPVPPEQPQEGEVARSADSVAGR
jgi:mono/diheme cytochrome c family protein